MICLGKVPLLREGAKETDGGSYLEVEISRMVMVKGQGGRRFDGREKSSAEIADYRVKTV